MAILECKDLSKRFGSVQALDTVNLKIEPGRVIGLLGPSKRTADTDGRRDPHRRRCPGEHDPRCGQLSPR